MNKTKQLLKKKVALDKEKADGMLLSGKGQRAPVLKTYKLYIGGEFLRSESGRYYLLPLSMGHHVNVCRASKKDFRDSVRAARNAFTDWAKKSAYNRGQILYRIAEMMEGRATQFIQELTEQGQSRAQANKEVITSIDRLLYYAGWADKYQQVFSSVNPVASSYFNFSILEPTGVVAAIAPQEKGLLGLVSVIAPVIVGGNTCVILASYQQPLTAATFAEVLQASDVPQGVVNILTGEETELLEHFASHMDVNAIIYCRKDSEAIKKVQELASLNVKRVILYTETDWHSNQAESPYCILHTQEIKTTWHPVGM